MGTLTATLWALSLAAPGPGPGCLLLEGDPGLVAALAPADPPREGPCLLVVLAPTEDQQIRLVRKDPTGSTERVVRDPATARALLESWGSLVPLGAGLVASVDVPPPTEEPPRTMGFGLGFGIGAAADGGNWLGLSATGGLRFDPLFVFLQADLSWCRSADTSVEAPIGGDDVAGMLGAGWDLGLGPLRVTPSLALGVGRLDSIPPLYFEGALFDTDIPWRPRSVGLRWEAGLSVAGTLNNGLGLEAKLAVSVLPNPLQEATPGSSLGLEGRFRGRLVLALVVDP